MAHGWASSLRLGILKTGVKGQGPSAYLPTVPAVNGTPRLPVLEDSVNDHSPPGDSVVDPGEEWESVLMPSCLLGLHLGLGLFCLPRGADSAEPGAPPFSKFCLCSLTACPLCAHAQASALPTRVILTAPQRTSQFCPSIPIHPHSQPTPSFCQLPGPSSKNANLTLMFPGSKST